KGSWSGERNVIGDGCVRGRVLHVACGLESLIGRFRAYLLILRSGLGRLLRHLRLAVAAYGVLLISLLLAGFAWYYVRQTVEAQDHVRFDETIQATQAAVDRRTDAYLAALFGARGVFLASKVVESEEWESYVEGIETKSRLEGLQALGFARYVRPDERETFVGEARKEGLPEIRPDLDPGGERSAYFPLALVAPTDEANLSMINQDAYTEQAHKVAMDAARDTGSPQATKMVYVLTGPTANSSADLALSPGFAVYLPVYAEGEPVESVAGRRRALRGFVVGYFRRDGLLDDVFGSGFDPAIDFEVYDGADVESSSLLYDEDGVERAGEEGYDPLFSEKSRFGVAGREWSLYFATLPGFKNGAESNLPAFVLASGIGASVLLFGISWMLVRSRILAERASKDLEDANRELEGTNRELEAFSYSVSHDLRAPLRAIDGFSQILQEDYEHALDDEGRDYLGRVRVASRHMATLIDDLLELSRVGRRPLRREPVDLARLATGIIEELRASQQGREVEFVAGEDIMAWGDASLLKVALENLLGNAWKFTAREQAARIEFGADREPGPGLLPPVYYVRDNGAGFDQMYADKLFGAFQRLHGQDEFEGTGIGLATVARIVHRHGGRVWAEGTVGEGATFYFTLGGRDIGDRAVPAKKAEVA
ncbi:MAG: CHASE domain-containing protein, partial [Actinomycetota bacterium]|nr:CHASE domain-containing protein [Actinomycetota bacterium]